MLERWNRSRTASRSTAASPCQTSIGPGTERREQIFVHAPSLTSTASTKSSARLPHCGAALAIYRSPKSQRRLQPHRAAVNETAISSRQMTKVGPRVHKHAHHEHALCVKRKYRRPSPVSYGLWPHRLPPRKVHGRQPPLESAGVIWLFGGGGDKNRFPLQPKTLYGAATLPPAKLYYRSIYKAL